eukprot:TRINITY_DN1534_c0_g1_i1.p1 TRINITY_DN1534_c0_g1~~TRINITY_DN1534_c0_g1_i1.p1  ORF type:complete len:345 (-),score=94.78 TRINITY_DN1534_c0_g1_i1:58-1092(-)
MAQTTVASILTRIEDLQTRVSNVKRAVDQFIFDLAQIDQGRAALSVFEKRKDAIQNQIVEIVQAGKKLDGFFWQYQSVDARTFDEYLLRLHDVIQRIWLNEKKTAAEAHAAKRPPVKKLKYEAAGERPHASFASFDRIVQDAAATTRLKIERVSVDNANADPGAFGHLGVKQEALDVQPPESLRVTLPNVFVAHIVFQDRPQLGHLVDRIVVHALDEASTLNPVPRRTAATDTLLPPPGAAAATPIAPMPKGPWEASSHFVFQKVSHHARRAVQHYFQECDTADHALQRLLLWLNSYHDLFTAPCKGCSRILHHDSESTQFVPPCFRTFDDLLPYHCHIGCHPL